MNTTERPEPRADGSYPEPMWPGRWRRVRVGEDPRETIHPLTEVNGGLFAPNGMHKSLLVAGGDRWYPMTADHVEALRALRGCEAQLSAARSEAAEKAAEVERAHAILGEHGVPADPSLPVRMATLVVARNDALAKATAQQIRAEQAEARVRELEAKRENDREWHLSQQASRNKLLSKAHKALGGSGDWANDEDVDELAEKAMARVRELEAELARLRDRRLPEPPEGTSLTDMRGLALLVAGDTRVASWRDATKVAEYLVALLDAESLAAPASAESGERQRWSVEDRLAAIEKRLEGMA